MRVKQGAAHIPFALVAVIAYGAGCDLQEEPSRVPEEEGGGGDVDPRRASGSDEGADVTQSGPEFTSCVPASATGNELGVGRYCEPNGGQCAIGDLRARFCMADFLPRETSGGCTFPCTSSDECGDGAVCVPDGPGGDGSGSCVVDACVPPNTEGLAVNVSRPPPLRGGVGPTSAPRRRHTQARRPQPGAASCPPA